MGSQTNQIATETNVEVGFPSYIDITTLSNKCITVKRLLKGLISTNNKPTYNTSAGTYNTAYKIKTYGSSTATGVTLNKSSAAANVILGNTSQIIETTAGNYGGYPFGTGTSFLAINGVKTITATITVTYVKKTIYTPIVPTSDDGVSTASMDFDNPVEDTESNTSGQEPTIAGNMSRSTRASCNNQGMGVTGCTCFTGITANTSCPFDGQACLLGDGSTCSPDTPTETVRTKACTIGLRFQIYTGGDASSDDSYMTIADKSLSRTVTVNTGISTKISFSIPTGTVFPIYGTPTGAFKFKLTGDFVGFDVEDYGTLSTIITATVPSISLVAYNPGPKCIKHDDLRSVYPLYGKTV